MAQSSTVSTEIEDSIENYGPFIKAIKEGDWSTIEWFIKDVPEALSAQLFPKGSTALHYAVDQGLEKIAKFFVDQMEAKDLEIQNDDGFTALAIGANKNNPDQYGLLHCMVYKNSKLASIGNSKTIPVVLASTNRCKDTTRYLYCATEENILSPANGTAGVRLLNNCIQLKMFDIAMELVQKFPEILKGFNDEKRFDIEKRDYVGENIEVRPISALAKTSFSTFQSAVRHKKSRLITNWLSKFGGCIMESYTHHGSPSAFKPFSRVDEKTTDKAQAFLQLVCTEVSAYDVNTLKEAVYKAMIEAAVIGNIEFINEMLSANPDLLWAHLKEGFVKRPTMFWFAIAKRQEKVFNLIYGASDHKEALLSLNFGKEFPCFDNRSNTILHYTARLPQKSTLDRISKSPALQIQRELQWFKEVWNLARPEYREDIVNDEGLTPRELFDREHEVLIKSGEQLMKDTAQSCTTVGALIVTIMFAAAFTVPGGNNQNTGYPVFLGDVLFKIFISCDALSLSSATASILIFLEILTSSYVEEDFLLYLPRKVMMGLLTLFISITSMMITFCTAIAIMFGGRTQFILPIALLASSPVVLFQSSIFSLVYQLYMFTFGPSIFDKNTKLPEKKEYYKKEQSTKC